MYKKMNSTEALSRKFSRIKIPNSVSHQDTPNRRPNSTHKKPGLQLLEQSLIAKNKKLTIMIRNVHHFTTNLDEIQWILDELQKLVQSYMKKTVNKYGDSHQIQIENLYNQLMKLVQRFTGMEKNGIKDMTIPLKNHGALSENINWWNLQKNQTIGSFKYTDIDQIENEEEGPSDFSRINLPTIVKQNVSMENMITDRQDMNEEIKQYKATIQILNEEILKLQNEKEQIKEQSMNKIQNLKQELNSSMFELESYRGSATASINKCKQILMGAYTQDRQEIERLLNQLFFLQNKIQKGFSNFENYEQEKGRRVRQLSELDWQIKQTQKELKKSKINTASGSTTIAMNNNNLSDSRESWMKMLFVQATTIEQILRAAE